MSTSRSPGQVLVTVIVPVRDVGDDIAWALDSLHEQGLGDGNLEVIVVDDASADPAAQLLDERARQDPAMHVIHVPEPVGPGAARNLAIEQAGGQYLFFLDVETALIDGALGALVEVADREGSDVVLGKMRGSDGRKAPRSMFRDTRVDADLVADNVFYTLSPYRLIRTDLVRRTGARFAADLATGEDQPFMARCYLAAQKVSICADRDYVLIRPAPRSAKKAAPGLPDQLELAAQVVGVVEELTHPGPLRDGVLRRTLRTTITTVVGPALLDEPEETRREIVGRLADALAPVWNPRVAEHLEPLDRTKVAAVLARDVAALHGILEWATGEHQRQVTHDDAGFRPTLPDDIIEAVGRDQVFAPSLSPRVELTGVDATGRSLTVHTRAFVESCAVAPETTRLRLIRRESEPKPDQPSIGKPSIDLTAARTRAADLRDGCALTAEFTVDTAALEDGVWDLFLLQRFGQDEFRRRLGARRAADVGTDPRFLPGADGRAKGQAYFTKDHGNLSIDCGFVLTKPRPRARIIDLVEPGGGTSTPTALLRYDAPSPVRVHARFEAGDGAQAPADLELASAPVGGDLIAVPLAVDTLPADTALRLVVTADVGEVVAVPGERTPGPDDPWQRCSLDLAEDGRLHRKEVTR